jgi:hypothetical protein
MSGAQCLGTWNNDFRDLQNKVASGAPGVLARPPRSWTLRLRSGQAHETPVAPPKPRNHYFKKNPNCSGGGKVLVFQY